MTRSVERRIQQLEKTFQARQPVPPGPEDLLFRKKVGELLLQMDQKYTAVILEDFRRPLSACSELTLAVCSRAIDHMRRDTPLAFPTEIAEVYLNAKRVSETNCRGCSYTLPAGHFKVCPICGASPV